RPADVLDLDDISVLVLNLPPRGTGFEGEVGAAGQGHDDIPVGALDLHVGQGQVGIAQLYVAAAGCDFDIAAETLDMNVLRAGVQLRWAHDVGGVQAAEIHLQAPGQLLEAEVRHAGIVAGGFGDIVQLDGAGKITVDRDGPSHVFDLDIAAAPR